MVSIRVLTSKRHGLRTTLLSLIALVGNIATARADSKTLDDCIRIAIDHKPGLKAASAAVDSAHMRVWQAASGYLPSVTATHAVERRKTSVGSSVGTDFSSPLDVVTIYSASVGFSQTLFDFGKTLASIQAARARQRAVEADRATTLEAVVLDVKQSYFDLLATQRLLAVAEQTVSQNRKQLDEAEARHAVGMAPRIDVTRAKVQLANGDLDLVTARNNVAIARETLRDAMGLDKPIDFELADTLDTVAVKITEDEALDLAYHHRPELISLDEQARAINDEITALERAYLPSVSGTGSYSWSGSESPLLDAWRVGATISVPVLSGGLTTAQILEQKANLSKLKFDIETQRQSFALEVRRALLNVKRAEESIAATKVGATQARENLEIAQGRYRGGVGNIIELTDAQTSQASADAAYVRALYGQRLAVAALEHAMGRPLNPETPR